MLKMEVKKRERKANFSEDETLTLIEEVSKERAIILGPFSTTITIHKKTEVWEGICFKLNAMFGNDRRSHELKKKWKDLKSVARRGRSQPNGTSDKYPHKDPFFSDFVLDILNAYSSSSTTNGINDCGEPTIVDIKSINPTQTDGEWSSPPDLEMLVSPADDVREKPAVTLHPSISTDYKKKRRQERESVWKVETQQVLKRDLKIKWLKSEIAKNNSIVELNHVKKEYILAKKAKLLQS